jgi:retron-type reverse transcriptase
MNKKNKYNAEQHHNDAYYVTSEDRIANMDAIQASKEVLRTPKNKKVTKIIRTALKDAKAKKQRIFNVLDRIYKKNVKHAFGGLHPPIHNNILSLVGHPQMLLQAYTTIRSNKGAMTKAKINNKNKLVISQKKELQKQRLPDSMNWKTIRYISEQVRSGKYVWGTSRRIWIDKPGTQKKRPITIPPFADKMVQESIRMVLEAIYEPWFDKMNVSFGFRAGKGTHDAMHSILFSGKNQGMKTAIEGDISGAYDNVDRDLLIKLIGTRISDKRFLRFLRNRLDLKLFDVSSNKFEDTFLSIPQGGIDSPYLFNIYMMEFDKYVTTGINELVEQESAIRTTSNRDNPHGNKQLKGPAVNPRSQKIVYRIRVLQKRIQETDKKTDLIQLEKQANIQRKKLLAKIKRIRLRTAFYDQNRTKLRYHYTRYADDWIIISNFPKSFAEKIKKHIEIWLRKNLRATLSMEKTKITLLTQESAKFLGFEFRIPKDKKVGKRIGKSGKTEKRRTSGWTLKCYPDNTRLINRLHMKGYCDKDGRPIALPWLSSLESFTIIEKYNAVMRGLANYYGEFITNKTRLYRWLYVLKYSCLKTLSQKYRTRVAKLFNKYLIDGHITMKVTNVLNHKNEQGRLESRTYQKTWRLLNEKDCITAALTLNRKKAIDKIYWDLERGNIPTYPAVKVGRTPRIKDNNFLDRINFVSLRTKASLDMPCLICGTEEQIEMHHVKHVRKTKWSNLEKTKFFKHLMAIRLRKQIPVCRECHMTIHRTEYRGLGLARLNDARTINPEHYIQAGNFEVPPWEDRLTRSGWKLINTK